jgi:hypothetical protein
MKALYFAPGTIYMKSLQVWQVELLGEPYKKKNIGPGWTDVVDCHFMELIVAGEHVDVDKELEGLQYKTRRIRVDELSTTFEEFSSKFSILLHKWNKEAESGIGYAKGQVIQYLEIQKGWEKVKEENDKLYQTLGEAFK